MVQPVTTTAEQLKLVPDEVPEGLEDCCVGKFVDPPMDKEETQPDRYPQLATLSAAFTHQFILTPKKELAPEFVYLPPNLLKGKTDIQRSGLIIAWNTIWETGHLRSQLDRFRKDFDDKWLEQLWGHNVYLLSDQDDLHHALYAPLYHMLPLKTLRLFGLPPLRGGHWPFMGHDLEKFALPSQVKNRLSRAFAYHVWPHLNSGSAISGFDPSEPIRLLAHNLDFWLPYAYKVAEERVRFFHDRVKPDNRKQAALLEKYRKEIDSAEAELNRPRRGGPIWYGEEDAREATGEMMDHADRLGRLRGIIDAVRSNRIQDDFSSRWSYEKEDFERKLYHKRSKLKVTFVELEDTVPVHGPESEVHENLLWEDFMALLNVKEKRIVVCLRNGQTKLGDIAKDLGYQTHSPISKALAKIRAKALKMMEA